MVLVSGLVTALGIKDGSAFIKGDLPDNARVVSKGLVALKALWLKGESETD